VPEFLVDGVGRVWSAMMSVLVAKAL
jgi:hypothetical protein